MTDRDARSARIGLADILRSAARPPVGDARFWAVQAMVVVITGAHLLADLRSPVERGAFPGGLPVALLILPVGYAALHYGLSGSAATGLWAALLWLPDLLLPHDRGHAGADVVNLALVEAVAFFVGQRIEVERLARKEVERATSEALAVEARYRQLFEANHAPILVLGATGDVVDANPAAWTLFGDDPVGRAAGALVAEGGEMADLARLVGQVSTLPDGRDYRIGLVALPAGADGASTQVTLEDVTQERSDTRRATRYAQLVVEAEEDQRKRIARELHDEPLQLFLHLARTLERLGDAPEVPTGVADGLAKARLQALDAAGRLRTIARDLRPPALDQLGFVAALSSLLADVEEASGTLVELAVEGADRRLPAELELGAFRIAEEAVRNAVRHGAAQQLHVAVRIGEGALGLRVSDDGHGFVPGEAAGEASGHLGLLGMRERTRLLGGHLELASTPGRGTVVEATFPLPEAPGITSGVAPPL